jgi:zinc transport system substrate-binding protein
MSRTLLSLSVAGTLMAGSALAQAPRVAVDIAPVHSLVARVMEGVGTPALIIQQGASPHEYNLRPSDAKSLQDADAIFLIGEDLTPWLVEAIETLAGQAAATELLETKGTTLLEFREGALFEAHDHSEHGHDDHHDDHEEEKDHDHDHEGHADDHDDHNDQHEHEGEHSNHGDPKDEHHDHDHGDHDPHAWLAPANAQNWLNIIAADLSALDPANAGTYYANAAAARAEIDALSAAVNGRLESVRGGRFVVFHDAYQYFETAFAFPASGAISIGDAADPSPARIAEIRGRVAEEGIQCVLSEPQFNPGLVATVMDGTAAKAAVLDPLGSNLDLGPDLYAKLLQNLAASLADCLS